MVFSEPLFLFVFLPLVMGGYYLSPKSMKNLFLAISGLIFYAWGEPIYVFITIIATTIDYFVGIIMEKYRGNKAVMRTALIVSLAISIGQLIFFKYLFFINGNLNNWFSLSLPIGQMIPVVGLSFNTFQSMSYTIDLYRGNVGIQRNFINFFAFSTLFPQIVAGPIVCYGDIEEEVDEREFTVDMIGEGISLFVVGLAKKVLLANNIGLLWATVKTMDYGNLSAITAWIGVCAFAFQIYFDFSGYSDMAVGLAKMMGFHFPKNFDYPYMSKSISEFWRRWHITMGNWFRNYLYIPLGGNRKGTLRTLLNLFIVWFVTGLWHGASWNFIIWGLYFGVILILERLFLGKLLEKLPDWLRIVYSFVLVLFGWLLFDGVGTNVYDLGEMFRLTFAYIGSMFGVGGGFIDKSGLYLLQNYGIMLAVCAFASTDKMKKFGDWLLKKSPRLVGYAMPVVKTAMFVLVTAYLVDSTYNPFLYFNF